MITSSEAEIVDCKTRLSYIWKVWSNVLTSVIIAHMCRMCVCGTAAKHFRHLRFRFLSIMQYN